MEKLRIYIGIAIEFTMH